MKSKDASVSFFAVSDALEKKLLSDGCVKEQYRCDVAVIGAEGLKLEKPLVAGTVVYIPGTDIAGNRLLCDEIVSVSMARNSSVTLTGICEERCMLALERGCTSLNGTKIEPCETSEVYDQSLSPEENMLYLTVKKLKNE